MARKNNNRRQRASGPLRLTDAERAATCSFRWYGAEVPGVEVMRAEGWTSHRSASGGNRWFALTLPDGARELRLYYRPKGSWRHGIKTLTLYAGRAGLAGDRVLSEIPDEVVGPVLGRLSALIERPRGPDHGRIRRASELLEVLQSRLQRLYTSGKRVTLGRDDRAELQYLLAQQGLDAVCAGARRDGWDLHLRFVNGRRTPLFTGLPPHEAHPSVRIPDDLAEAVSRLLNVEIGRQV